MNVLSLVLMTQQIVAIQLSALLAASTYDKDQPVVKWGGLLIAVVTLVVGLVEGS